MPPVRAHVWEELYSEGQPVAREFGMYTYVLLNQDLKRDEASQKFLELVEAIRSTPHYDSGQVSTEDCRQINLFLVPYDMGGKLNLELSKRLTRKFAMVARTEKLRGKLAANPGPFLITTPYPLYSLTGRHDVPTLYLDLTSANTAAIREIVAIYKRRLSSAPVSTEQQFTSVRMSVLNTLLNMDDCISIVKNSYAAWIE